MTDDRKQAHREYRGDSERYNAKESIRTRSSAVRERMCIYISFAKFALSFRFSAQSSHLVFEIDLRDPPPAPGM